MFLRVLPPLQATLPDPDKWSDESAYYRSLFATYCASYCCGVSTQHLSESAGVHPIIVSVMRFHIYFTIMRLVRRMESGESMASLSREYGTGAFYGKVDKTPRLDVWVTRKLGDGTIGEVLKHIIATTSRDSQTVSRR